MKVQSVLDPAGPAAQRIAELGWLIMIAFLIATAVVWLLLFWVAVRRRGTLAEHMPIETTSGTSWILIGGILIPGVVLAVLYVISLQALASFPLAGQGGEPLNMRIIGQQWWFSAEYLLEGRPGASLRVPTEIHIPVGRPVDMEVETRDVIHSFWVPRLHGKIDLTPGLRNRIRIVASKPGVFRGECAEFCGVQHAHMRVEIVAQPQPEFDAWLAQQSEPAHEPTDAQAQRGKEIFMNSACVLCHTVRGTRALASVGPDLTHLGSRERIAGGMLENNKANLTAWVTHAQSLKPGSLMPDLTQFTGQELNALVAYLRSLQ